MNRLFLLAAIALSAQAQPASFRWIRQIGGSGNATIAGIGTDSSGNTYVVGNTNSIDLPVQNALQPNPGGSGLFRVDGPGANWRNLYQSGVNYVGDVATDPRNPRSIYAASRNTLLHSPDAGDTWEKPASFDAPVRGIAVDPTNSAIIYVSTAGRGIFKSIDGGGSWTAINKGVVPNPAGDLAVYHLWIDPTKPSVLYASLYPGLLRSADAGASWQRIISPVIQGIPNDLSFDPFTPGIIYTTNSLGAAISRDDGLTWFPLGRVDSVYWQPDFIVSDPRKAVLYGGTTEALWKSTDGGASWTRKIFQLASPMTIDRSTGVIYAVLGARLVATTDGFDTITPVGPPAIVRGVALAAAGGRVFIGSPALADVFVAKFDPQGNQVYTTFFGGSAQDVARAMTVDAAGNVYVTGTTESPDFGFTPGTYAQTGTAFVFKVRPDASLAWCTGFSGGTPNAIAADAAGHAYIAGLTYGSLPVTPGAYQPKLAGILFPPISGFQPPTNGFVTEFDAAGASLIFSTYLGGSSENAKALALFADRSIVVAGQSAFYKLNASGSALLATRTSRADIRALAADGAGNILAVGGTFTSSPDLPFPTTPGAFQTSEFKLPNLPGTRGYVGGGDGLLVRLSPDLEILTSTLLGGEGWELAMTVARDAAGNIAIGGSTTSNRFPTRGLIQESFAHVTGFVSGLSPDFSTLVYSTFAGDTRTFRVQSLAAAPDGGLIIGGLATLPSNSSEGIAPTDGDQAFVVRMDPASPPGPRIDTVLNAASKLAVPISPGETLEVRGANFDEDATLLINGSPLTLLARSSGALTAAVPADFTGGAATVEVRSGGKSVSVLAQGAASSPGIFSQDGTGIGQGYVLNEDGTLNSPSNPAKEGAPITVFATGVGTMKFTQGYAETDAGVLVIVDGFLAPGIAAVLGPVEGLPGDVYRISVYVPRVIDFAKYNPNLNNFKMPPQVALMFIINGVLSQPGLALSVAQ